MYLDRRHAEVCRAAVVAADDAQNIADEIERALDTLPASVGVVQDMIDLLAIQYGTQETLTALCLGRPLKLSRVPQEKGRVNL